MITIPGQLAIKTIHGRNGDFNVGRLATSIGEFVVKNAELDQYREGKYDGDFVIVEIRPSTYNANGRMVIEIRAHLGGMTLSNIDALSRDEARRLSPQEVDPIDEEAQAPAPASPPAKPKAKPRSPRDPLVDTTPFGSEPAPVSAAASAEADDAALFGALVAPGRDREARCDRGSSCAASAARPSRQAGLRVRSVVPGLAPRSCLIHPPPCAAFRHPPGFSPDGEGSGLFFKETLMGWTFVRQTRDQLIRELLAPQASERACCEVIDHTLRRRRSVDRGSRHRQAGGRHGPRGR